MLTPLLYINVSSLIVPCRPGSLVGVPSMLVRSMTDISAVLINLVHIDRRRNVTQGGEPIRRWSGGMPPGGNGCALTKKDARIASPCIGPIGLGRMGPPITKTLLSAGFEVVATSQSSNTRDAAKVDGLSIVDRPADVAARAHQILISVFDNAVVEAVIHRKDGVY
jgi:hypothetical protein